MEYDEFKAHYPEHDSRIIGDTHGSISLASGVTLFDEFKNSLVPIANPPADETETKATFNDFCSINSFNGPLVTFNSGERLGHFIAMNHFSSRIADPILNPAWVSGRARPAGKLGSLPPRVLSDAQLRHVLVSLKGDAPYRRPESSVWCLRGAQSNAYPFKGEPLELMPCRLGLKRAYEREGRDPRWIAFTVEQGASEWRAPTFADPSWDFLLDWMPGGSTVHGPAYNCGPGYREVLGRRLLFNQLVDPHGPISAQWPA